MIAEIQQVSQAKTVLFMLQKLQKESEAQLKAIPASTGADKKQLLAQLRTNAEKWLQNFGLLLKNDQNNLNLFHQKMLQLAAKFGINIVAKKQEIPPAYLTLVNPYIEAFDRLDHRGIQATMVVAAQDLQIVNELRAMFVNIDALKQATPIFMNDANISFQDKMDLQKHINKIMWPKIKMVESYFQMSANPPANR